MKGIVLSLFVLILILRGKVLTSRQIAALLVFGLISLAIAFQLSSLIKSSFLVTLQLSGDWSYAKFAVATGYSFVAAAVIATIRKQ